LALNPKFIVCDEPVSALDVSIQSQVLNILKDLQVEFGLTYLFIAHNLSVVEHISDRVAVMYLGKMVEFTDRDSLYREPFIPTQRPCSPPSRFRIQTSSVNAPSSKEMYPARLNPPRGCRFHTRCPVAIDRARRMSPSSRKSDPVTGWLAGLSND
jgi:ABC-type oligopeptide transport system ATPase subunit